MSRAGEAAVIRAGLAALSAALLSGCATTADFRDRPHTLSVEDVCDGWYRAIDTSDLELRSLAFKELARRGREPAECRVIIDARTQARTEALRTGLGILAVALTAAVAAQGAGGNTARPTIYDTNWAWDEFYGPDGLLMWACRGTSTGQFADQWRCAGQLQIDSRWPAKTAP